MKQLTLFRHAQAENDSASGRDFDRALSQKGMIQAGKQGLFLKQYTEITCGAYLCSSALRTRQTLKQAALANTDHCVFIDDIYNASTGALIQLLENYQHHSVVLMVGHNPGLSSLATFLCGRMINLSPASVVTLQFKHTQDPFQPNQAQVLSLEHCS